MRDYSCHLSGIIRCRKFLCRLAGYDGQPRIPRKSGKFPALRVYICTQLPVMPVSSYLAFPSLPRKNHGSLFLLHFPGGLPRRTLSVILPCDARTFLTPIPYGDMARDSPICGIYYSINFGFCQGKQFRLYRSFFPDNAAYLLVHCLLQYL